MNETVNLNGRFNKQTTLKITTNMETCINRIALYTNQTKASVERQFLQEGIERFRDKHKNINLIPESFGIPENSTTEN